MKATQKNIPKDAPTELTFSYSPETHWSGNNKVTQEALDMKILIPIHGGAGYFQNVGKLPIE